MTTTDSPAVPYRRKTSTEMNRKDTRFIINGEFTMTLDELVEEISAETYQYMPPETQMLWTSTDKTSEDDVMTFILQELGWDVELTAQED